MGRIIVDDRVWVYHVLGPLTSGTGSSTEPSEFNGNLISGLCDPHLLFLNDKLNSNQNNSAKRTRKIGGILYFVSGGFYQSFSGSTYYQEMFV